MSKLKEIISLLVIILVVIYFTLNYKKIGSTIMSFFQDPKVVILEGNEYTKNKNYLFVKHTDTYVPYSYNDLLDIYYSALDQGWEDFTFYCPKEYQSCVNDVEQISKNEVLLSSINNYVHPFNSYSEIKTVYDEMGEINLKITHLYSQDDINRINYKLDEIFKNNINDTMTPLSKLRALHDYIVNNTIYDVKRAKDKDNTYDSARMNGLLFDGYGICSAYADIMATIMYRLDIDNFKVSSSTHVWNAVYVNDSYLHLDATWDDPVNDNGMQSLSHEYYLITTNRLKALKNDTKDEHVFDNSYYLYFN